MKVKVNVTEKFPIQVHLVYIKYLGMLQLCKEIFRFQCGTAAAMYILACSFKPEACIEKETSSGQYDAWANDCRVGLLRTLSHVWIRMKAIKRGIYVYIFKCDCIFDVGSQLNLNFRSDHFYFLIVQLLIFWQFKKYQIFCKYLYLKFRIKDNSKIFSLTIGIVEC